MGIRVAVLGGGVGGLSAAHELIERGFEVVVYERIQLFGGKARSLSISNTGTGGLKDLPGEHGFRFFPAFYRHLPDTMMRIPDPSNVSVLNNLVHATRIHVARAGKPPALGSLSVFSAPDCRSQRRPEFRRTQACAEGKVVEIREVGRRTPPLRTPGRLSKSVNRSHVRTGSNLWANLAGRRAR